MRILIITSLYPDESPRPVTNAVHDLVRFWTDDHEVVCFKEEWLTVSLKKEKCSFTRKTLFQQLKSLVGYRYCERDGVKIFRFTCISNPFSRYHIETFRKLFGWVMACKMNRKLKDYKPDVVLVHMPTGTVTNYLRYLKLTCPKIAIMHMTDVIRLAFDGNGRAQEQKKKVINDEFTVVFSRSHVIYKHLKQMGNIRNLKEIIISSGVPGVNGIISREWAGWISRKKNILYAGDLIPLKGVDVILKSLARVKRSWDLQFLIVGDGVEYKKLCNLCKDLDGLEDSVRFLGRLSRDEVYKHMRQADVFVMPSHPETLGLVYLEAMANGCITIGSQNEGIDGIIINEVNGFLVKALDVDDLTNCFEIIFRMNEEELEAISDNAKATAGKYTQKERAEIYLEKVLDEIKD